jgi:putative Holliday junction resolvase
MRALALDLGSRRIGVALCDGGGTVATPYETVHRSGDAIRDRAEVIRLAEEADAEVVVVGLPISLDGTDGAAAAAARAEAAELAAVTDLPVVLHDERLTTVSAERSLRTQGVSGRRARSVVDQVAASVILQDWLDGGGPSRVTRERL